VAHKAKNNKMPLYESLVILGSGQSKKEMVKLLRKVAFPIVEDMGVIRSIDNVGIKPLAVAMTAANGLSYRYGHFIRLRYDCNPLKKTRFEKELTEEPNVLRFHSRKIKNRDILYEYLYFNRDSSLNYMGSREIESFETMDKLGRVPDEAELEEIRKRVEALGINLHDDLSSSSDEEVDEDELEHEEDEEEDDDEEDEDSDDDNIDIEDISSSFSKSKGK
jgi:ribosomal protein S6